MSDKGRSYEDEKREAMEWYYANKPEFRALAINHIKTELTLIARVAVKNFNMKCDRIIKEAFRGEAFK